MVEFLRLGGIALAYARDGIHIAMDGAHEAKENIGETLQARLKQGDVITLPLHPRTSQNRVSLKTNVRRHHYSERLGVKPPCPRKNRFYKLGIHLSHNIQQHGVARVCGVVVRRGSRSGIVDNPPDGQIGSVRLRAEEPLVVASVNREVRMLRSQRLVQHDSTKR